MDEEVELILKLKFTPPGSPHAAWLRERLEQVRDRKRFEASACYRDDPELLKLLQKANRTPPGAA